MVSTFKSKIKAEMVDFFCILQKTSSGNVKHPCYPKGYNATVTLSSVYNSPCVSASPGHIGDNVTVEGTGDPSVCQMAIKNIFNFSGCLYKSCSFNGTYQPAVHGKFYVSNIFFFFVYMLFKLRNISIWFY